MPIVGRAEQKNSGISERMPRANTAETIRHNGALMKHTAPPHPGYDETLKLPCRDSSAGVRQAVRDT